MKTIKMLSWNVNGIRAVLGKGFLEWLHGENPDILCLQETKASPDQLSDELLSIDGYRAYFSSAEKKGYSGVALYTREDPVSVAEGMGIPQFDTEGRVLAADYGAFILYNVYFPNGKASDERLRYKMDFYDAFLAHVEKKRAEGRDIIVCGDVNTAHKAIDLARPKENETISGFLPEERAWIDRFLSAGYVDTFRAFDSGPDNYTWWHFRSRARERNVGWRIDYFYVSESFMKHITDAFILPEVTGSDHCPIGITVNV